MSQTVRLRLRTAWREGPLHDQCTARSFGLVAVRGRAALPAGTHECRLSRHPQPALLAKRRESAGTSIRSPSPLPALLAGTHKCRLARRTSGWLIFWGSCPINLPSLLRALPWMFRRASHLDTAIQPPSVKIRSRSFAVLPARKRRGHARRVPHREHLHSCGEPNPTGLAIIIKMGSSPRLQGTLVAPVAERPHGIISACAGSTCRGNSCAAAGGGHPRMRGEHLDAGAREAAVRGSSPHARGALAYGARIALQGGIIPACAGSI